MTGRTKRVLIGCGIGCGGVLLIFLVAAIAFGTWITGKGELLEPQRLLGAETTGYLEWTLRLKDPGTEGFLQLLIEAIEAERAGQAQRMPVWLRQLILQQNKKTSREMRKLFPVVAAWTMAPSDESGKDEMLFTVSPTGIGNRLVFVDWLVSLAARWGNEAFVERYRDENLYRFGSGSDSGSGADGPETFFLRRGTLFFTTSIDSAKVAVDRLQDEEVGLRREGPLDPLFAETSADQTIRGALSNARGEIPRLWNEVADREGSELLEALRGVTLDGGLREDGSLAAALRFRGPDRRWAEAREEQLRELIENALQRSDLDLQVGSSTEGGVVRVEVRIGDIIGAFERWIDEQERRSGVRINL